MMNQYICHELLREAQQRFDALTASHAEVCATLEAAQARVAELEGQLANSIEANETLGRVINSTGQDKNALLHKIDYVRKTLQFMLLDIRP